ncbi:MAG: Uma2 family endonuclease [Labedaea sp.]
MGVNLAPDLHRIPDLVVIRDETCEPEYLTRPPVLAVEVASRSTRKRDRTKKFREYEEFGIESYWIVEPEFDRPSLTAYELRSGCYERVGLAAGDQAYRVARPFPVTIVPALLVTPGSAWKEGLSR